jgi:hypothetical protein
MSIVSDLNNKHLLATQMREQAVKLHREQIKIVEGLSQDALGSPMFIVTDTHKISSECPKDKEYLRFNYSADHKKFTLANEGNLVYIDPQDFELLFELYRLYTKE